MSRKGNSTISIIVIFILFRAQLTTLSAKPDPSCASLSRQSPVGLNRILSSLGGGPCMSQQAAAKPSLQGVRIKARKGAVKAHAKHEPASKNLYSIHSQILLNLLPVFRDQLYKHLETVPEGAFDSFATKLIQAGSQLEFLKYADALFEIILVGGLIQPGGSYIDDGAPVSPFTVFNAKEPVEIDEIKKYIEVLNKLIRRCGHWVFSISDYFNISGFRYKYLQKPLEELALPGLLQYINRWSPAQKDKLSIAVGLLISQGLANASCLQSLTKDHLVKNGPSRQVPQIL